MIPLTDLARQHERLSRELEPAVLSLLRSGNYILGEKVQTFEAEVAAYLGVDGSVGVSSASDGLVLSLLDAGIGPGDEVITTPLSFVATAEAILRVGAIPVFADVDPGDLSLTPESVLSALSARTRAVIVVHLFGHLGDVLGLSSLCKERGLVLIEDAAQAFGARCGKQLAGSFGDYGVFSFFPAKVLGGAGDGGLVVANAERRERLKRLRVHGHRGDGSFERLGGNFRLDAMQAAVLSIKLGHVEEFIESRTRLAARYNSELSRLLPGFSHPSVGSPGEGFLRLPDPRAGTISAWNYYTVRVPHPDEVSRKLSKEGVASARYYRLPLHRQPCFEGRMRLVSATEAERASSELLALPLFPELTLAEQDHVIRALGQVVGTIR